MKCPRLEVPNPAGHIEKQWRETTKQRMCITHVNYTAMSSAFSKELYDAARQYYHMGWCVFPVAGKVARVRWRHGPPRPEAIEGMWHDARTTGVAVSLGEASGGVVARDFDVVGAYDRWSEEHADLASMLPRSKTARGGHVFARIEDPPGIIKFVDGELRPQTAATSYCLPPGIRPGVATNGLSRPARISRTLP